MFYQATQELTSYHYRAAAGIGLMATGIATSAAGMYMMSKGDMTGK